MPAAVRMVAGSGGTRNNARRLFHGTAVLGGAHAQTCFHIVIQ